MLLPGQTRKTFKGSKIYFDKNSRTELPFLKADEPVPVWKLIKSFIGQDLTKVSMPVEMNEPATGIQRAGEAMCKADPLYFKAANCDDPVRRMALTFTGMIS